MNKYYYDLHIHSCLSPCGDGDMTPANIAGMAAVKGLQIAALTDHNSTENCPAFFSACRAYGIIPVAGMELTVSEDIHLLCLFRSLESAMDFGREVDKYKIRIKNRPDIFGHQIIMDHEDKVIGEEESLLLNATMLSLDEGTALVKKFGGVCYPAHIDRESNGAVAVLGAFPDWLGYTSYELSATGVKADEEEKNPCIKSLRCVVSSDAHYLWDISEAENYFLLEDEPYSSEAVRNKLIDMLEGI
ncbi:MAG: PHP domain-containing protein [Clostridia bacterium]|nr:PHP domain-containing protein [Clostridia bacterium]